MVSVDSTSSVIVLPMRVLTKICIVQRRQCGTLSKHSRPHTIQHDLTLPSPSSSEPLTCTVTQATRWRQDSRTSTAKHHSERERERETRCSSSRASKTTTIDAARALSVLSQCSQTHLPSNSTRSCLALLEMSSDHRSDAHDGLSSM